MMVRKFCTLFLNLFSVLFPDAGALTRLLLLISSLSFIVFANYPAEASNTVPIHEFTKSDTSPFSVEFKGGLFSIDARGIPLGKVLEEIGKQSGFAITIDDALKAKPVTVNFSGLDITKSLRSIINATGLGGYGLTYKSSDTPGKAGQWVVDSIVLVDKGHTSEIERKSLNKQTDKKYDGKITREPKAIEKEPYFDKRLNRYVEVVRGEVLVRFPRDFTKDEIEKFHKEKGTKTIKGYEKINVHRLKISDTESVQEFIEKHLIDVRQVYIEPVFLTHQQAILVNDPSFNYQWAIPVIQADKAWEINSGSPDAIVAVIDTGIDINHPDLKNNVISGIDIVNGNSNGIDDNGHGTYVAGIIAAESNNSIGIAGISWKSKLMPVKVLTASGEGAYSDLIEGIIYAVDHGARLISLSLGGYSYSQFIGDAIQYAHSSRAVIVAAGGNENTDEQLYPAAYPNVIAVSATDPSDRRWFSSNYGSYIKLSAPGVGVLSTQRDNSYGVATGTSVSTAHVSGVAALILSKNPDLSNTQVENILYQTADDLGDKGWDSYYGFGRVNALKAIEKASIEVHDVAVTGIRIEPETFKVGEATKIIVTVENQGTFAERGLSVNSSVNSEVVDKEQIVLEIIPGEKIDVSFNWLPLIDGKEFTVQAEVKEVEGETETNDNKLVRTFTGAEKDGLVMIKHKSEPNMQTHQFMAGEAARIWPGGDVTTPNHHEIWDYIGGRVQYTLNNEMLTHVVTYGGRYNGQPITVFDPWTLQPPDPRRIAANQLALPYSEFNYDIFNRGCIGYTAQGEIAYMYDLQQDGGCPEDRRNNLTAGPLSNGGDDIIEGTHEEDIFDAINYHKHDDRFYNGITDPDGAYMFAEHLWKPDVYDADSTAGGVPDTGKFDRGLTSEEMGGIYYFLGYPLADKHFGTHRSAYSKAQDYWDKYVIPNYKNGNKDLAYYYLGRVVHLLEDMSSVPHVHNELHGLPFIKNNYEDDNGIVANYTAWSSYEWARAALCIQYKLNNCDQPIDYNNISTKIFEEWYSHSGDFEHRWPWWVNRDQAKKAFYKMPPLFRIFYSMAETSDDFPSDMEPGDIIRDPSWYYPDNDIPDNISDNSWWGGVDGSRLVDDFYIDPAKPLRDLDGKVITTMHYNVEEFSRYIQPIALRHVAGIYKLFWDTVQPPTVNTFHVNPISSNLGDTVNISYDVSDMGGLKQVELWRTNDVNGAPDPNWPGNPDPDRTKLLYGQTSSLGSFSDVPQTAGIYWYGLHVVDNEGNWNDQRNSNTGGWPQVFEPIKVMVTTSSDTTPPSVSITSPSNDSTVSGNVTVTTSTDDNIGVSRVEFYKDNSTAKAGQANSAPFSWSWNTTDTANGTHILYAKAFDAVGNIGTSSTITVNINNTTSSGGNNAPSITTYLTQHKSDGTGMAAGDTTNERTIIMKGGVTDPDGDSVSLDVEVKAVGTNFNNSASLNCTAGNYATSGSTVAVTCTGLADGQYKWQARAKDNRSPAGYSAWVDAGYSGDVADFIVSAGPAFINYPPSVNLISPHGGEILIAGNSYDIKWNATDSTGIVQYIEVYLSTDGGVNWQLVHTNEPNDGLYTWTPAITTTQARIKVEAIDSYGDRGRDVSDGNFTISPICTPPLVPVLYGIGTLNETGTYSVSWSSIIGATSYTLQEAMNSSFTNPIEHPSLSQVSKSISGKTTNTYYYHVKANNSCGSSSWSNWESIEVLINQPPYTPGNPTPADGAINISRRPTLSWSGGDPDGTVDYAVFFGTNPNDLPGVRGFNSGTTAPSYTINYDLNPGTTYYWYIKAKDDKGLITPGPIWRFTTGYSYADLIPTNLTIAGTVAPNAQVILNLTVKNQGTYTSPGAQAFFYLSAMSGGKEQKLQNLGTVIPQLAPGEETTISQTVTLNNLKAGQSYIDAWIDTQIYFVEGDLGNNTYSSAINYQDGTPPVISGLYLQGTIFRTGYASPIVFTVSDDIGVSSLDFYSSLDNGTTWEVIATGFVPGFSNTYYWSIPATFPLANQLLIKMVAHDSSSNSAEAIAGPYTIVSGVAPAVRLLSPNGGETWDLNSTQTIRWSVNAPNGIRSMYLTLLYADQIYSIADITSNTSGSYQWNVPNWSSLVSNSAKIRIWVEDLNANVSEDYSDAPFTIRDASTVSPPWATPVPVTAVQPASQSHRDDKWPAIRVDASGNAHMVYVFVAADNTIFSSPPTGTIIQKIMYQKRIGGTWTSPTVVYSLTQTPDTGFNMGYRDIQNLKIAVDSKGNPHIIWAEQANVGITTSNHPEINDIYYTTFNGSSWSAPVNVSNSIGVYDANPAIAIDLLDNIHVVWRARYSLYSGIYDIYYRKKDNAGNWSSISQLTAGEANLPDYPSLVSDTTGNLHLIYKIDPDSLAYMKWDGTVWSRPVVVTSQAASPYPIVTSDRLNNLHLVWHNYGSPLYINQIFYSSYDGVSWSVPVEVSDRITGQNPSRPSIVSDSVGRPHIIWEETGNQYRVNYKAKNPQGWSTAVQLNLSSQGTDPGSSAAAISPADHMHVVWTSFYSGHTEVFYNHADVSVDTAAPGISLLTPTTGETLSIGSSYPITYTATDNTGVAGITLKYTTDGGTTFTPIAQGLPNTGTYNWTVPNVISNTVEIIAIASDAAGNQATAYSGLFRIADETSPTVSLLSPNGGELFEYNSVQTISWTASDNVTVSAIDLFYTADGGLNWIPIASGEPNDGAYIWTVPNNLSPDCLIKIVAYDTSGRFTTDVSNGTFMIVSLNNPPLVPNSPTPLNSETYVSFQPILNWNGGDADTGDTVTYTVYFGNSNNPAVVSVGQTTTDYNPGLLAPLTTYYWIVAASDGKSSTSSPLWSFTTGPETIPAPTNLSASGLSPNQINLTWTDQAANEIGYEVERKIGIDGTYSEIAILPADTVSYNDFGLNGNTTYVYRVKTFNTSTPSQYSNEAMAITGNTAPNTPSLPFPTDAATSQAMNPILQWSGGDPDPSDNITYDVYFGASSNPTLISSGQSETYFIPGVLEFNSVYYWRVMATDSNGNISMGPLWYFVTEATPIAVSPTGSISINNGDTYSSSIFVTLNLSATNDVGITGYYVSTISSAPPATDSGWTLVTPTASFSADIPYTLSSNDGTKTIYVWYKGAAENVFAAASDSIILDTIAPTGSITINGGNNYINSTSVTLTLSASDSTSGVSQMCISNSSLCSSWEAFLTTKSWTLSPENGTKTVYVSFKDSAGNVNSSPYSNTIILDSVQPTTTALPAGGTYTSAQSVALSANESATIYYTTDGTTPTTSSSVYSGPINISTTTTLKFFAVDNAGNREAVKAETYTINAAAQTKVSGILFANTTWALSGSPYLVTGDVQIPTGVTLTIEPGVTVKYGGPYQILVKGAVIANGTADNRIIFTSATPNTSSGATMLKFEGTNLSLSQLSYLRMEYASKSVRVGEESEFNQKPKNTGTLTVSNIEVISAEVLTDGYDTQAKLVLNNATISGTTVRGEYPRSEPIEITNSTITNSIIHSESYNKGITLRNSTVTNTDFRMGCCGANIRVEQSILTRSAFQEGGGSPVGGPLNIAQSQLINTGVCLSSATVNISDSTFTYDGTYSPNYNNSWSCNAVTKLRFGNGGITHSSIMGNGGGVGLEITGYSGYGSGGSAIISNSIISQNESGILLSGGSGAVSITDSNINNSNYNIQNKKIIDISAINNYWGTATTSEVEAKIYDYYDNISFGKVNYSPLAGSSNTTPPITLPSGFAATISGGDIALTWNANPESDVAGYTVYWDMDSGHPYANAIDVGNVTSYIIAGIDPTKTYYVTVTAYDATAASVSDNPSTVVNERQIQGNESWYAKEANVPNSLTPVGENVTVSPGSNTTVTFSNVSLPGDTTVSTSDSGLNPPSGFYLGNSSPYYDITTTATYSSPVTVCIAYDSVQFNDPSKLRLFHYENNAWLDVTTSHDMTNHIICGHVNSLSPFAILEADTILPIVSATVSPSPNTAGWHNTDAVVSFACSDAESGIESCPSSVTVSTEGAGQTITGTATDRAGNYASTSVTLNIDKTVPGITASLSNSANANGWHRADVVVSFICSDAISGIETCQYPVLINTEGGGQSVAGIATDKAGNSASTSVIINLDKTPPALTCPLNIEVLAMELTGTPSGNIAIQSFLAGAVAADNLDAAVPVTHNAPAFFPMGNTTVTFTAMDDAGNQGACHAMVTVKNPPPVFDPVANQTVNEGDTLVLTVSATDPNNDPLVFSASGLPAGAAFDSPFRTFSYTPGYDVSTPSVDSFFDVFFSVSDGTSDVTMPVRISVHNVNRQPAANAGPDQNIQTGSLVTLDGSGSSDPDGDLITFNWAQTYRPAGSAVNLSDTAVPQPTFIPDVAGYYGYDLVVCDPAICSGPDSVTIYATAPNVPPNANAGADQNVLTGLPVLLNGGASNDPDNGPSPMLYQWSFMQIPAGSSLQDADITGRSLPLAGFVPEAGGAYQLDLAVSDGVATSHDQVLITAAVNVPPTANAGLDQTVLLGQNVTLDGLGSYDSDNRPQPITYQWSFVSVPGGSALTNAALTGAGTSSVSFKPDITGSYLLQIAVSDGQAVTTDNAVVTVIQPKANSNGSSSYFSEGGYNAYATFDVKYQVGATAPSGSLTFNSGKTRRKVVSTGISSLTVTGKTAMITGPCTLNGISGYNFTAMVADNATPGSGADTFSITITGPNGFNYTASGTIISGDYMVSR